MFNILVVEDTKSCLELLKSYLSSDTTMIFSAFDGKECLEVLSATIPNVIILDIMLPKMDGIEVLKIIKENNATKNIPVLLMTAQSSDSIRKKGWDLGASDFLSKPLILKEVETRIGIYKEIHELKKQLKEQDSLIFQQKLLINHLQKQVTS